MSNYWDLYCKDCDVKAGAFHWNHGEKQLRGLLYALPSFGLLGAMLGQSEITIKIESGAEWSDWPALVEFSKVHGSHNVRPRSEYGHTDDECGAMFHCGVCNHGLICKLTVGHDGAHDHRGTV